MSEPTESEWLEGIDPMTERERMEDAMTTDNRTNEPTPEQVEAAAKALRGMRNFDEGVSSLLLESWSRMVATTALVAAQGAEPQTAKDIHEPDHGRVYCVRCGGNWPCQAPQAESVPKSSYISPSLPGMIRNLWKSDPSENSVRTALKLAGDLIQELIDLKAAPVLPSSGNGRDRPDDSNYDEAISDSENFQEAIVAICEKYGVPVTNNIPRWQDGVYLRHAGDFVGDVKDAAERHLAIPVLPSSGVDEDKLAEVLRAYLPMGEEPALNATAKAQARAVAEWLKGQGDE